MSTFWWAVLRGHGEGIVPLTEELGAVDVFIIGLFPDRLGDAIAPSVQNGERKRGEKLASCRTHQQRTSLSCHRRDYALPLASLRILKSGGHTTSRLSWRSRTTVVLITTYVYGFNRAPRTLSASLMVTSPHCRYCSRVISFPTWPRYTLA
jgi:hypothetical protein